ncbi:hypothetical protein [Inhella gelatinilytica]|uniref:Uncharacterized protein n=1 Tax=Inhella gelatinilytica TaxID=2795030 RepID=A0A931ITF1_9BURK|nr:hypothetical protein [Inhella gelatinilytica]MBH9551652.1 hypothetical protein [Inhella gelatinilytica]
MDTSRLSRRAVLALTVLAGTPPSLCASPRRVTALWSCTQLRVCLERLVKLELERRALPHSPRPGQELAKERLRTEQRLVELSGALTDLGTRRRQQVNRLLEEAEDLLQRLALPADALLGRSEALAARMGFVTLALSTEAADPDLAQQLDLLSRAGSTALRVGKLNFAAYQQRSAEMAVPASQALVEFQTALNVIGQHTLSAGATHELAQAQTQWVLFRASLGVNGLVKSADRLGDVATTTDRIAQSLGQLAIRLTQA